MGIFCQILNIIKAQPTVDSNERIPLGWKLPSGQKPNERQWSIIEAHEKGHSIRPYYGKFFRNYFSKAFDVTVVEYTEDDYKLVLKLSEQEGGEGESMGFEEHKLEFFSYLFCGIEIAERMSQLKNYFGFKDSEEFTIDHLRYAKEHYVKDVGFDNLMTAFLKAVTPETEEEFIKLINSSGI